MATEVSSLAFQTHDEFVAAMTTAYGASLNILPLLLKGDPALALFEATATQDDFIQFLLKAIWTAARASTAVGSDLDSFVADFGMTRLPATYAQSRAIELTALTAPAFSVPVYPGTVIQTPGAAIQYQLIADPTQSSWSSASNAYILPAGETQIIVTAQALVAGSSQNVQAGQISQFASAVTGVDVVTNSEAITNGLDAETDPALRIRFVQFIASLSEATEAAILFAANSVQQGLDLLPLENTNVDLESQNGINTLIVDDGSGTPPSSLLQSVYNAIDKVRAFGIELATMGPTVADVSVSLTVTKVSNLTETDGEIQTTVQKAVLNYVNAVQLSDELQYLYINNIAEVAKDADANVKVVNLGSVKINGTAADYALTAATLPRTTLSDVVVTVS